MLDKRVLVAKVGGSVLTDKGSTSEELRSAAAASVALFVQRQQQSGIAVVLCVGAGSAGHTIAARHGLCSVATAAASDEQMSAAAVVRTNLHRLCAAMCAALHSQHCNAWPLWPAYHFNNNNAHSVTLPADTVVHMQQLMARGCVPLLFGDICYLASTASLIALSSDIIAARISAALRPHACVFVGDTALWTADPRTTNDAQHVAVVRANQWKSANGEWRDMTELNAGPSAVTDVTGGMQTKLANAQEIAKYCPVAICSTNAIQKSLDELLQEPNDSAWTLFQMTRDF
jgi:isopentenyl phosphate kinase